MNSSARQHTAGGAKLGVADAAVLHHDRLTEHPAPKASPRGDGGSGRRRP
jgi:hypothetical protein